jgi:ubiquinone/menaquinone biosynthesis C-methylase UbiE
MEVLMSTGRTWQLYDGAAETYERFRPRYPQLVLAALKDRLGPQANDGKALDTGAGTGIFSRLLIQAVPELSELLCIEPNEDMVRVGRKASAGIAKIQYSQGFAEELPAADSSLVLVTAATAANWFDRPIFYREAIRVLKPGGLLALLHTKHADVYHGIAGDLSDFLERCIPGYQRGTYSNFKGGYARADFSAELRNTDTFDNVSKFDAPWTQYLTPDEFRGFCYSMGHIKKAQDQIGAAAVADEINTLIDRHTGSEGHLTARWITELTMANARAAAG